MAEFRAICHPNGYPCSWEKMGLNNVSLMSGSTASENVSEEMSPAISTSNHLMGSTNLHQMAMLWSISGLHRWNESGAPEGKEEAARR